MQAPFLCLSPLKRVVICALEENYKTKIKTLLKNPFENKPMFWKTRDSFENAWWIKSIWTGNIAGFFRISASQPWQWTVMRSETPGPLFESFRGVFRATLYCGKEGSLSDERRDKGQKTAYKTKFAPLGLRYGIAPHESHNTSKTAHRRFLRLGRDRCEKASKSKKKQGRKKNIPKNNENVQRTNRSSMKMQMEYSWQMEKYVVFCRNKYKKRWDFQNSGV